MDRSQEIRLLPPVALYQLVQILELGQAWKQLMAIIPKSDNDGSPKYKVEHMRIVECASGKYRRPCSEILLDEWGCSGRKRPTLALLLDLLVKASLFRAADYVAVELLKESPPSRPNEGPAALVDVSDDAIEKLLPKRPECDFGERIDVDNHNVNVPGTTNGSARILQVNNLDARQLSTQLPHFSFIDLKEATLGFSEEPYIKVQGDYGGHGGSAFNGRKIGTGAFGSVYLGHLRIEDTPAGDNMMVAIKKLNQDAINLEMQFRNEVEMLSRFKHPNLLPLLGYSCDGPSYCLVYEYMSNGSLLEKLACKDDAAILMWLPRLDLAFGIAKGIVYLHTALPQPLVHRDIKSANILLDADLQPKLGDFGLVRLGGSSSGTGAPSFIRSAQHGQSSALLTTTVLGTSAYMAPEAFRGDVSVKLDTFSFGVVLLELLTSLPPYDGNREGCDLVTHVDEICIEGKISPLLDSRAGSWGIDESAAQNLFEMALSCLEEKRKRPKMVDVLSRLESVVSENQDIER
ncbi:interleukin-1 receptor-associated kinase 4-like [Ischnura elegans]|uniref:interleukin-1 receptor-associated kinase 4-like n=1 Tax=Ischnura elegans TaxID=197161 RepID=UPI001ED87D4C|nr:interleukin-1 receptor-associated kinase 4-like [Ischnura elegans]